MASPRHLPLSLDGPPPDIKAALKKIEQQKKDAVQAKKNKKLREKQALDDAKKASAVLKTADELDAETATMDRYTSMVHMAMLNSKMEAKKKRKQRRIGDLEPDSSRTLQRTGTMDAGSTDGVEDDAESSDNKDAQQEGDMDSGATSYTSASNCRPSIPTTEEAHEDDKDSSDNDSQEDEEMSNEEDGEQKPDEEEIEIEQFDTPGLSWYNPIRRTCGRIVTNEPFQFFIVFLIILNSIQMGLATFDFVEDNPPVNRVFTIVDTTFLVIFTVEIGLNLAYYGYKLFFDGWLVFDLSVVVLSWAFDGVQIFRSFRIFRAFRLVAKLDVLKDLVAAIVAVLPRIASIMMLFSLVLYIYAVLCTVLFGPDKYGDDQIDYFGRLDYSLFTLFQYITLDNWGSISREVMMVHQFASVIFLSFLCVSSFILYSLVVAVVCDAVAVIEHPDIAVNLFKQNMVTEKAETQYRIAHLEKKLDSLSRQQMGVLLSVQAVLVDLQERETMRLGGSRVLSTDIDNTTRSEPATFSRKSFRRGSRRGPPWRKSKTR